MPAWLLTIEYDGTDFVGFQRQARGRTVQAELEAALARLFGTHVKTVGAGRTDTGVHARGQAVSFQADREFPPERLVAALNYYLPPDIAVLAARRVPDGFNARRAALSRQYRYLVLNRPCRSALWRRFAHHEPGPLDLRVMGWGAGRLVGRRDFGPFSPGAVGRMSTVRTLLRADVRADGDLIKFDFEADAFLPHQVRMMVGTLLRLGQGRLGPAEFEGILAGQGQAGPAVPGCGLYLMGVTYPKWVEEYDENLPVQTDRNRTPLARH